MDRLLESKVKASKPRFPLIIKPSTKPKFDAEALKLYLDQF